MTHAHGPECEWVTRRDGKRRCKTARNQRERTERATLSLDGFEEEFGPVPQKVSEPRWYDQVAVDRALDGEPVGRDLTPREALAVRTEREAREVSGTLDSRGGKQMSRYRLLIRL